MKKWIKQFHTLSELDRNQSQCITRGYYGTFVMEGGWMNVCIVAVMVLIFWDLFVLIYRHREVVYYITRTRTILEI